MLRWNVRLQQAAEMLRGSYDRSPLEVELAAVEQSWKDGIDKLIRRMAEGDEEALEQLIRQTESPTRGVIRRSASWLPEEEVDDIQCVVYIKAWNKAWQYTGDSDAAGWWWLRTTAAHHTKDVVRKLIRVSSLVLPFPDEEGHSQISERDPLLEDRLIRDQGIDEILEILTAEECQILEWLAEGCSQVKIAEKLGKSGPAVSQEIKRIRKKAARFLGPEENDNP